MEAYEFETTVLENGMIKIPEAAKFANRKVEIFIVIKSRETAKTKKNMTMEEFLDKWMGFLKGVEPDEQDLRSTPLSPPASGGKRDHACVGELPPVHGGTEGGTA